MNALYKLLGAMAVFCVTTLSVAHTYPEKPVKIVVPFPPGGGVDILIRAVANELSADWGQAVVIENRPGAGSIIGAANVARAKPDGYTLLATINQTLTSNRYLYKDLPYEPDDFVPISLMTRSDHILLASENIESLDLGELVQETRRTKNGLTYGSFGSGSQPHLLYSLLKAETDIDLLHVPYKGIVPALTAVVSGEVDLTTGSAGVAGEMLKAGRIRALAVAGTSRSPWFPDVPTTVELGYPELLASVLYVLVAPPGTPEDIALAISNAVNSILDRPDFKETQASSRGLEAVAGGPDVLRRALQEDTRLSGQMIEAAGVKPE